MRTRTLMAYAIMVPLFIAAHAALALAEIRVEGSERPHDAKDGCASGGRPCTHRRAGRNSAGTVPRLTARVGPRSISTSVALPIPSAPSEPALSVHGPTSQRNSFVIDISEASFAELREEAKAARAKVMMGMQ